MCLTQLKNYAEGKWVGAGEPMMYITGSFFHLVDLETIFLQKLGPACVAAYNAYTMCADMPKSAFLAMDARHCAGQEMAEMMAYAASVGVAMPPMMKPITITKTMTQGSMRMKAMSAPPDWRNRPEASLSMSGARDGSIFSLMTM